MQTKQYTLLLLLILCLSTFAGKAYVGLEKGKSRPTDSIMNLQYNADTYLSTRTALAKMDKPLAVKLDSAVQFVNNLPACWAMAPVYKYRMPYLRYNQLIGYSAVVKQEYLLFSSIEDNFPATPKDDPLMYIVDKPVLYLYPTTEQRISVNLGFEGTELYTWPKIDSKLNWTVTAKPDGMLKDAVGEEYPYLFWEGKMNDYAWINTTEGFVVPAEETELFFREKLKYLGLNSREYTDFITFWAPRMRKNKYNLIHFETTGYNAKEPLTISPSPESSQRILMIYKGLDTPIDIKEQKLEPFTRKGYTLIEWGGMEMPEIVN
jgi:hypothetical protein